jgi:hypothetical protein
MFTGQAVGKGFETSGRSSAYMKTVDYTGFKSASLGKGKGGIMFFSGSVLSQSGDEYQGVGLELFGTSESFFKFRSDPSELQIQTQEFFVGSRSTSFLSASQGQVEISSSNFHLDPLGNVRFSGSVDATDGRIGGFEISQSRIQSTNRKLIFKDSGQISASSLLLAAGDFVIDPDNLSRFGTDGFGSFVMAEDSGVRIQTSDFNLNTARFIISSSDVGVMAMGSTPPAYWNSGKGVYMDGDGNALFGDAQGERIQFNGFNLVMSSSAFFLGNQDSYMSGSLGRIVISGSTVGIQTPNFFFGTAAHFISGSGGNLEISSSRFHLTPDGNVKLIGRIEAESGFLGGFGLTKDAITGSNIIMSGSPEIGGVDDPKYMFISASNFNLKENGDITGSRVLFTGGRITGSGMDIVVPKFFLGSDSQYISGSEGNIEISSSNFHLDNTGNVTMAGTITATTGKIGGFNIGVGALSSDNFFISGAATNAELFISSSGFSVDAQGIVSASALSLIGGAVGGLHVAEGTVSVGEILKLKDSGQITGSQVLFSGGSIGGWDLSSQIVSSIDANGGIKLDSYNKEITVRTGSHVDSTILSFGRIGGSVGSPQFGIEGKDTSGNTLFKLGEAGNEIGGFRINSTEITSSNNALVLRSSGEITGSQVLFSGGKIAGWEIDGNILKAGSGNFRINGRTVNPKLTIGTHTVGSGPGIQVGYDSGNNVTFFAGESASDYIKYTAGTGIDIQTDTLKASGSNIILETPKFFLGQESTAFVSGSLGNVEISSSKIHIQPDGNVVMNNVTASNIKASGNITATSGQIGGFTIDGTKLKQGASFHLDGASDATYFISSSDFQVTPTGEITGSEVLFTKGKIAGWTISGDSLLGNNATLDGAGAALFKTDAGPDTDNSAGTDELRDEYYIDFTPAGQGNTRNFYIKMGPNFMVDSDGILVASGAKFIGTITASAGLIGGFTTDSSSFHDLNNNIFISGSPKVGGVHHPSYMFISSSNFNIKQSGDITGSQVLFTGGKIGGFEFGSNLFTATNFELDPGGKRITLGTGDTIFIADADHGIQLGDATFGDAPFSVTTAGVLKATSGTVGGFTIDADEIKSTNLLLDSTNEKITVGSANAVTIQGGGTDNSIRMGSKTAFAQSTTAGVILGMDSTIPTLEMYKDADNKFIFNNSGVEIKAATFDLATTTLILDSGTNNGKVALGATPPTAYNNGSGFYVDGNGKLLVGSGSGERIQFDGNNLLVSSSDFYFGNNTNFISGSSGNIKIQSSGETTLSGSGVNILTPQFFLGKKSSAFVSGSSGNIEISASSFHLDRLGNVTMSGSIKASDGTIGGFTINPSTITATNFTLDPANKFISLGSGDDIFIADADTGIQLGDATFGDAPFSVTKGGFIKSTTGEIGGFRINSTEITSSANGLVLRSSGQITGSNVLFTGGVIAGFNISGDTLVSTDSNFTLDASNRKISLGSSNNVFIADADDGIQLGHATFASAPFSVTKAGLLKATSGTIGGWSLGSDRLFSDNINITSTGTIETSDFASGVKGWRISALNNGTAEFENATIRGTMKTAVFEKETVNAVGGQLYVANSTVLSGSGTISASYTTMSVDNVSGFTGSYGGVGEILSLKKVSATGFSTEYILVQSASRLDPSSDTNFSGKLFVVRGYSGSLPNNVDSSSLGDIANPAQDYEPGQVVVSTGISGSGYIRLNANPTTNETPYIDIVERTGSAIYDIELKARLGDLSGLSSAKVGTRGGFGLFTERAFLTKDVTVGTLGTEHVKVTSGSIRFRNFETTLAELRGDTWTIGGAHGDTSDTVVIDGDGVTIFGNDASTGVFVTDNAVAIKANGDNEKVTLNNSGMTVTRDAVDVATFGVDTVIKGGTITLQGTTGGGDDDRLVIGSAAISLYTNDVKQIDINDSGLNIGPAASAGNPTIGNVRLSSDGVYVYGAATNDYVFVKSDGVDVVAAGVKQAFFGATSSIGNTADGHISMSSEGLFVKDGTTTRAQFGSDVTMQGGTITLNGTTGTVGHDRVVIGSADIALYTNNEKKVHINDSGMNIGPAANAGNAVIGNVRLGSTGAYIYGAATDDYVFVKSDGVDVYTAGTNVAAFGATTTIGDSNSEHVEITSTTLKLKDGTTDRITMNEDGVQIGSVSNGITLDSSGNATFNGALSVGSFPEGTVSGSAQLAEAISGSFGADSASAAAKAAALQLASASMATQVVLNSNGMDLKNTSGATLASYGTTVTVGESTGTKQNLHIDSDSVDIRRGTQVTASFGATTTIGPVSSAHTFIDSGSLRLKDGSNERLIMDANGIRMGDQFSVDSSGNASFSGTLTVSAPGTISSSAQLADAISGSSAEVSASLAASAAQQLVDSASVASSVQITSAGMNVLNASNNVISEFGANVFVGLQNAEHVKIGSSGLELKDNNTVLGKFVPDGVTIGDTSKTHISASTLSVNILTNSKVSASFGTTTTIGPTSGAHTLIDSGSLRLKDGSDIRLQMDAKGIRMGNQFSVDSSGDATFAGTLSVGSLPTGTVTGSAQLADAISGSSNAVSTSLAAQTAQQLVDSASVASSVQITSEGINVLNSSNAKISEFGANVFVGLQNAEHVKISSAGLELKDDSAVVGKFVPGGATIGNPVGNAYISMSTDDISIITGSNRAVLRTTGLEITQSGVGYAQFAGTTTIGNTATEHVEITSTTLKLKDGGTTRISMDSSGVQIGAVNSGITLNSDGDATFKGALTIGDYLPAGSVSGSAQLASAISGSSNAVSASLASQTAATLVDSASMAASVQITSAGMNILNGGGLKLAEYGTTVTIGQDADDKSRMVLGATSLDLIVDDGGTDTNFASFGAITRIGDVANEHISASSAGIHIKDGSTVNTLINAKGATFGDTSKSHISMSTYDLTLKSADGTDRVNITNGSLSMIANNAKVVDIEDGSINIGPAADAGQAVIGNVRLGSSGAYVYGATTNDYVFVKSSGVEVVAAGTEVAEFGATTTIGNTATEHIKLSSAGLQLKDGNTTRLSMSSAGIEMGDNFSVNSSGNVTMAGTVTADAGKIGGFVIQAGQLTGSDGISEMLITGSGLISAGDFTSTLKQAHFGVLVSRGQKFVSASLAPQNPNPLIESEFSGLNRYDADQQTGMQLNYGNYFKIAGSDGGSAVFRVGEVNSSTSGDSAPPPFIMFGEDTGLRISSSKFSLQAGGGSETLRVDSISATEGTLAAFKISSDGLTGFSDSFNGTSSLDDTTLNLEAKVGAPGALGSKTVTRKLSVQAGKVVEGCAIHYKGPLGAHSTVNANTGLSDAWIGVHRDMKEDNGWFQDTYMNNNFANAGKYSFIQIQIDTGSSGIATENTEGNNIAHGSTGIHLGYNTSQFSAVAQAPLGSTYIGHTNLSLFANGRISGSHASTFSAGTLLASSVVRSHGDVVAYYSSDERLKDNIRTIEEPIYKLRQLKGVEYEWNDKQNTYASGSLDSGIIAQDVQKVLPQLVKERNDGWLGVRHDRLVGLLVESIKDQQDQIDEMKKEIKELKNGST